ncbi:MAG: phage tail protein, partial [Eubacteriales bacterium]|nr:phage tail protein [Eubacteriales bacterium]
MGYSDFGLKIGIEGEQAFRKSLSEINQSFKVLGSEMNLVTSQFDKQDKSVGALTARNQVLRKENDAQKDKVETLEAALQNAASSFGENDKR